MAKVMSSRKSSIDWRCPDNQQRSALLTPAHGGYLRRRSFGALLDDALRGACELRRPYTESARSAKNVCDESSDHER